jgi:hypothetical protein
MNSNRNRRLAFYALWLVLAIIQASLTELQDDEAYYWVFSKFPAWGYFDHPPIIAILIRLGTNLLPGELGVRILPLLLNFGGLLLIERLIPKRNDILFFCILLSICFLQLGGFMAVPDTALLFFTALFLYCFRKFSISPQLRNSIFLGISIALLFYTKYQGLLVVVFAFIAQPHLFLRKQTWLSGTIALALFLPHLSWEYQHNWVSFRYHLFQSNVNAYKVAYTFSYIGGQLLLAGPIASVILLPVAFVYKPASPFERSLKWIMTGIYLFFLLSSFRGEVELNWTIPALVPLIILSHQSLNKKLQLKKWLYRLLPLSLLLVLAARILMIEDWLPVKPIQQRFYAWKSWPKKMKTLTKGLPIVFSNSYQRASKYWFYSGQKTLSQNHVMDHSNNYDYWPIEKDLLGKPVYFLDIYDLDRFPQKIMTPIGEVGYRYDSAFLSFSGIKFNIERPGYRLKAGNPLILKGDIKMDDEYREVLNRHVHAPVTINLMVFKNKKIIKEIQLPLSIFSQPEQFDCTINLSLPVGHYQSCISIVVSGYNPTHNSNLISLVVE